MFRGEVAFDLRNDVHHVRVAFDDGVGRDRYGARDADTAEVVAGEVDQHQVLSPFLRVGQEVGFQLAVSGFVDPAWASASDGPDLAAASREAHVDFRRRTHDVEP